MALTSILDPAWRLARARDRQTLEAIIRENPELLAEQTEDALTGSIQNYAAAKDVPSAYAMLAVRAFLADYRRAQRLDDALDHTSLPMAETSPLAALGQHIGDNTDQAQLEGRMLLARQALHQLRPETERVWWATIHTALGEALFHSAKGDRAANLLVAAEHYGSAIVVWRQLGFKAEWAKLLGALDRVWERYALLDPPRHIERAIAFYDITMPTLDAEREPIECALLLHTLGNLYMQHPGRSRAENVDRALRCFQEAAGLRAGFGQQYAKDMANSQVGLANAYLMRVAGDQSENIEQAIEQYQAALAVYQREVDREAWAEAQYNLAVAWRHRHRGQRAENIERALRYAGDALKVYPENEHGRAWARVQAELATLYCLRLNGDRRQNLEQGIDRYRRALDVYDPSTFPTQWARALNNLANAYCDRHDGDRRENLGLAIGYYSQALAVRKPDQYPSEWAETQNNLGTAYADRRAPGDFELAEQSYRAALTVRTVEALPAGARQTHYNLGNLYFAAGQWPAAIAEYEHAIAAAERLYQAALLRGSQQDALAEISDLYHRAAFALARDKRPREAVVALELGRARGLGDTLARDRADLERIRTSPEAANQAAYALFAAAATKARELDMAEHAQRYAPSEAEAQPTRGALRERAGQVRAELASAIDSIRQVEGYETFLAAPNWNDVAAAIPTPADPPLVYLVTTSAGSMALLASAAVDRRGAGQVDVESIDLPGFTQKHVFQLIDDWLAAQRQARARWLEAIDAVARELWPALIGPVVDHLRSNGVEQAMLIPSGLLGLLPLHAAWFEDRGQRTYAIDRLQLAYAPSARALGYARRTAIDKRDPQLLAVADPESDARVARLPGAAIEAHLTAALLNHPQILRREDATKTNVLDGLAQAHIAHFACHGVVNRDNPELSGLILAGKDILTVEDLLGRQLANARLAVLSACETGVIGMRAPDEVIALPAAFLRAGFAGVAASLWSVSDLSTTLLMRRFYELWRKHAPAQALRLAQLWLRDTANGEMRAYCQILVRAVVPPDLYTQQVLGDLEAQLDAIFPPQKDAQQPFAHPYYWAAFQFVGV